MVTYQRPLSGTGFGKRQLQRLDKVAKRLMRAGIAHAAAAHHQRATLAGNQRPRLRQTLRIGRTALDVVHTTREEAQRVIPRFPCTSCGRQIVTAPVSAGSVSVRIALSIALMSCSGRLMRSQ